MIQEGNDRVRWWPGSAQYLNFADAVLIFILEDG